VFQTLDAKVGSPWPRENDNFDGIISRMDSKTATPEITEGANIAAAEIV